MSMYIPEIKEEVSENAKMLVVEEDGKIYRAAMPSGGGNILMLEIPEEGGTIGYTGAELIELFNAGTIIALRVLDGTTAMLQFMGGYTKYGAKFNSNSNVPYYDINLDGNICYKPD